MRGNSKVPARLCLADGVQFRGISFGAPRTVSGEVVFNTGMVGYPESLTDPSYHGQILVLTYPLIGNYGVPFRQQAGCPLPGVFESNSIKIAGLIVQDYHKDFSHWSSNISLGTWLKKSGVPALTGVDTRSLAQTLRHQGVMLGKLEIMEEHDDLLFEDPSVRNLVAEVSCNKPVVYQGRPRYPRILLYDCGVKFSIIRSLMVRGCTVIRVPWNYDILRTNFRYDGVVISNGPGDPKMCEKTIVAINQAIAQGIPVLGICLGSQLLALAVGANTYKLKYGHRSHNQPCLETGTKRCYITSQNHGYTVERGALPRGWAVWFENANDKTIEGIRHVRKPFMAVQFHPEANPGPTDTSWIFDTFLKRL